MKCNLCGSYKNSPILTGKDFYLKTSGKEYTLVRCENCGLIFNSPPPSPEEIKKSYPPDYLPHGEERVFYPTQNYKKGAGEEKKYFLDFG